MKLQLKDAFKIIEDAAAIIIDNDILVYPALSELTGEDENEFLYLSWEQDSCDYSLKFNEADNKEVEVIGNSMFLYDTDCEDATQHTQITILIPRELTIDKIS